MKGTLPIAGLEPKVIRTELAQYTPAVWSGNNESGYEPLGDTVIVLIDQAAEKTTGGILLDDVNVERLSMAAETGVVAALGEGAFLWNSDRRRPFVGIKPKPGDRVYIERYAGQVMQGVDGRRYRLMVDKQVGAIDVRHRG